MPFFLLMPNWLLPEHIADVLPSEARKIEELRRTLLDHFRLFGYELVAPPLLEYVESLLTGAGQDLDLRMFKLVDQLSGRTMAVRADMTTQVARIDAHLLNRRSVTRLCYAGSVLHARPAGLHSTREPFQIGAEIYGHAGLEADAEIQQLALDSLALAKVENVRLDMGHVGILRALLRADAQASQHESTLFALLESKNIPELHALCACFAFPVREAILALPTLYGELDILDRASALLSAWPGVIDALDDLRRLAGYLRESDVRISIDLGDLRGYHYHSGVMFSAYVSGLPNAVLRGGRYDHVGEAFGRARPATGFSLDLRELARILPGAARIDAILAPWSQDPALRQKIAEWRQQGEIVIQNLPGHDHELDEFSCTREAVLEKSEWILKSVSK